ncbi:hypothetical protein GG681_07530 [Epibacterium sp. SM1969]|uniref:Uncharacterized protein n=1 Tax=Tritonibacter aquimaris TaxID=2663379 RepID=A0A844AKW4_9RHOB|nr:DUF6428 family protein [Tritonibacter aquimaris]MQY42490.1 hypothetical protein [Tritonibacter aquimaris]
MNTLLELMTQLQRHDPNAPLVFATAAGEIAAGYHVTELRHYHAKGIDCGGRIDTWQEARLQLLDGAGETHMRLAKFLDILEKSITALPELKHAALQVEFGHNNAELRLMSLEALTLQRGRVVLQLGETRALCKPAQQKNAARDNSCCRDAEAFARVSSCCVPNGARRPTAQCCA